MRRCVCDLLAHELATARRSAAGQPPRPWDESLALDRGLGADSLDLMTLAAALAEAIQLERSGIEDALLARRTLGAWLDVASAGLDHFDREMSFRTSGSTGVPRRCVHPLRELGREVGALAELFADRKRIAVAVPAHHIYGFIFTVLLPARLGIAEDDVIDLRGSSPAMLASRLRSGDLVVAHPDFWGAAARAVRRFPGGVLGVTSTAPCPDATSVGLLEAGLSGLHQVYGSTETAGIGWRPSHGEPYRLFDHWTRGITGELVRSGDSLPVPLQDHLEWVDDRRFTVGARADGAVQVGGTNVFPSQVREALLRHPRVADAAVRAMRPDEGTRLKAFVVPRGDAHGLEHELREWIERELPVPSRPRALRFGDALPRYATGKLADWDADVAIA